MEDIFMEQVPVPRSTEERRSRFVLSSHPLSFSFLLPCYSPGSWTWSWRRRQVVNIRVWWPWNTTKVRSGRSSFSKFNRVDYAAYTCYIVSLGGENALFAIKSGLLTCISNTFYFSIVTFSRCWWSLNIVLPCLPSFFQQFCTLFL